LPAVSELFQALIAVDRVAAPALSVALKPDMYAQKQKVKEALIYSFWRCCRVFFAGGQERRVQPALQKSLAPGQNENLALPGCCPHSANKILKQCFLKDCP
jgi:hypothetical protein